MRLRDRVAIITGVGSGIGRRTAELFASEGAKLICADIDRHSWKRTAREIEDNGGVCHFVEADIALQADAQKISLEAIDVFGRIDILVNNAAVFVLKGLEATVEEWHQSLAFLMVDGGYTAQ